MEESIRRSGIDIDEKTEAGMAQKYSQYKFWALSLCSNNFYTFHLRQLFSNEISEEVFKEIVNSKQALERQ